MKSLLDMSHDETFAWIRECAPSAGKVDMWRDAGRDRIVVSLTGANLADTQRLRTRLGLWSPLIGPVEVRRRVPHLYRWGGRWWVSWNGPNNWRRGLTLNDNDYRSLSRAMAGAKADLRP